jgi:hypothetical protein
MRDREPVKGRATCPSIFKLHGHDPKKCDVIVCWVHNWPECPKHIEVIELSKVVREMYGDAGLGK